MLCKKPFRIGVIEHGCGQCVPCRVNRRRLWTCRMLLESMLHEASSFVTLTYDNEHLPEGGTLVPEHLQLFFKRLRKCIAPKRIRYYAVGEYGEQNGRPHYHAVVFGLGPEHLELIKQSWSLGLVHSGELSSASAAYVTGYITKFMSSRSCEALMGRHPEFARMSTRPGIAAGVTDNELLAFVGSSVGALQIVREGDVPSGIRIGGTVYSLGRYLRNRLRRGAGYGDSVPLATMERLAAKRRLEELDTQIKQQREARRKNAAARAQFYVKLKESKRTL